MLTQITAKQQQQQHLFNGPLSRSNQKGKTNLHLLEQEIVSGSGISWATCKSAPRRGRKPRQHPTIQFLQAGCPSCRPTNSVKALKAEVTMLGIVFFQWGYITQNHLHGLE